MSKFCQRFAVGGLALLLCSCSNESEVAKARAEATAAKEEAAQAKATVEALKTDVAILKAFHDSVTAKKVSAEMARVKAKADAEQRAKVEVEVMKRWNATAGGMTFDIPNWGKINFSWTIGNFPHPTFKGGSAEAYGAFAQVLVAFLKQADNFDYLSSNQMFTAELRPAVPGGSGKGAGWTFTNFVEQFSSPNGYGKLDDETRNAMKALAEQIRVAIKKQEQRKT